MVRSLRLLPPVPLLLVVGSGLVSLALTAHHVPIARLRRGGEWPGDTLDSFVPGLLPDGWVPLAEANTTFEQASPLELSVGDSASDTWLRLRDNYDLMYILSAEVGTPPRTARLIVDTGSSDLWLTRRSYAAADSRTSKQVPGPLTLLQYGQGQVEGSEVQDNICFGTLCVKDQAFVSASDVSGIANIGTFDGLLGLAYPALAKARGLTFLQELSASGPFRRLAFGLWLRRSAEGEGSFLTFGDLDDVLADASRLGFSQNQGVALPVSSIAAQPKFWMVRGSVQVGDSASSSFGPTELSVLAALDSGTSLLAVPGLLHPMVMRRLLPGNLLSTCGPAFGQMVCPCDINMRPLKLTFSGDGRDLTVELTSEDLLEFVGDTFSMGERRAMCRLNLQPGPPSMSFWILGDVFLRRVYAVHDIEGQRVVLFPRGGVLSKDSAAEHSTVEVIWSRWMPWQLSATPSLLTLGAATLASVAAWATAAAFVARRLGRTAPAAMDADGYCRL